MEYMAYATPNITRNCTNINSTTCKTEVPKRPSCTTNEVIVYMTIYCIIILLVVSGNSFVIYKIYNHKTKRRTNLEILILYLSSFDLLASLVIIIDVYENLTCYQRWLFSWFGCKIIYLFYHVSLNMSICILIIMSVDRCRSIVTPLRKKFSRKSIHIGALVSLIVSVIIQYYQIISINFKSGMCYYSKSNATYAIPKIIVLTVRDFTFMIVFTITSAWIHNALLRSDFLESCPERKKKETKQVVVMLMTMEVVFTLLVLPYDIFDCIMLISRLIQKPIQTR